MCVCVHSCPCVLVGVQESVLQCICMRRRERGEQNGLQSLGHSACEVSVGGLKREIERKGE